MSCNCNVGGSGMVLAYSDFVRGKRIICSTLLVQGNIFKHTVNMGFIDSDMCLKGV